MKSFVLLSTLGAIGAVMASPTKTANEPPSKRATLPKVSASGNAFWADGKRFYIRGIDYKPGGNDKNADPLTDTTVCNRDIKHFTDLGVNTIRIYAIDNSKSHDDCMQALSNAGIYVVADVNNGQYSINRNDPALSYNTDYLQSVFATVEMMAKYDNTLAFFSGNEVINDKNNTASAPYIKAVTRDVKNYISSRGLRAIPVGYSAADVAENRMQTAEYMNCGPDNARSDFFAFNDYSFCNSNFVESGWDQKVKNFTNYGLPIFLSEYGCTKNRPRKFDELSALMNKEMTGVYSGGVMFEYTEETNDYGIVKVSSSGDISEMQPEYNNFKTALSNNPTPTGDGGAASTTHAVSCPSDSNDPYWGVNPSEIPAIPTAAEKFMKSGAGKGPGLDGPGSQTAGDSGLSSSNVTSGVPSPTGTGGSSSSGSSKDDGSAAGSLQAPLGVVCITLFFGLLGTLLL